MSTAHARPGGHDVDNFLTFLIGQRAIQQRLGITTIFVTHDQEEALSISDRIVVMNGGLAEQVGTPFEIYNRPATRFVANFVGTLNTLKAEVVDPASGHLRLAGESLRLPDPVAAPAGEQIALALRPESLHLGRQGGETVLQATIDDVHFMGSVIRLQAEVAGGRVVLDTFNRADMPPPQVGARTEISFAVRDVIVLDR